MSSVTYHDLTTHFSLLRTAPEKFLAMANEFVGANPDHAGGYFRRNLAWKKIGRTDKALNDLHIALKLEPNAAKYSALGTLYHRIGRFPDAIQAFNKEKELDPHTWTHSPLPLFRADCYARLGNEAAALADCISLPDDHFLPYGVYGIPKGDKQQATGEIRRRAIAAHRANR
jgi:tetratricopeptide (TPR) repeat protein